MTYEDRKEIKGFVEQKKQRIFKSVALNDASQIVSAMAGNIINHFSLEELKDMTILLAKEFEQYLNE